MSRVIRFLSIAALCCGCINTQRVPGPMTQESFVLPLGQGADYVPGPTEVVVLRHGDPVQVRRPGAVVSFPLTFYNKRLRLGSGGVVVNGVGGRVEVQVPGSSTAVQLFDRGAIVVGEPTREEPVLSLIQADRASLHLAPGDRISLVGGVELEADATIESGPFDFRTTGRDRVEIANHGRTIATLLYLDQVLALGPGEVFELPLLPGGTGPLARGPEPFLLSVEPGFWAGDSPKSTAPVEVVPDPRGLRVLATDPSDVTGLGVKVHLSEGEEVLFQRLDEPAVSSQP
ncbi:MAG: hypothetical protein P8N31_09160 [Planctomycetota bacterium]|jgi:hypothetical protein|nr:hypothetical protein [Planctomycetota bacterium]